MYAFWMLLFWIVTLVKNPGLPGVPASEVTTAELVFAPFRMVQFLSVSFEIGVLPTEPKRTTIGPVVFVFSIVRLRSLPPPPTEPSIVTRLAPTNRTRPVLAVDP